LTANSGSEAALLREALLLRVKEIDQTWTLPVCEVEGILAL
jgi:hypothetical protein